MHGKQLRNDICFEEWRTNEATEEQKNQRERRLGWANIPRIKSLPAPPPLVLILLFYLFAYPFSMWNEFACLRKKIFKKIVLTWARILTLFLSLFSSFLYSFSVKRRSCLPKKMFFVIFLSNLDSNTFFHVSRFQYSFFLWREGFVCVKRHLNIYRSHMGSNTDLFHRFSLFSFV